jgi:hypothetical protein
MRVVALDRVFDYRTNLIGLDHSPLFVNSILVFGCPDLLLLSVCDLGNIL